jgi:hypothetical protein
VIEKEPAKTLKYKNLRYSANVKYEMLPHVLVLGAAGIETKN